MILSPNLALAAALLGVASAPAQAQVIITPHSSILLGGQTRAFGLTSLVGEVGAGGVCAMAGLRTEAWVWTVLEGGGSLDEASGAYTAEAVATPCLVKVRATHRHLPALTAEATLLVLPFEPFDLVGKVLGADWVEPYAGDLASLHPATGQECVWPYSFGPGPYTQLNHPEHFAGYGIPFTLRWPSQPGTHAQLLAYQEGVALHQRDVSGTNAQVVTATDRMQTFTVQGLQRAPGPNPAWRVHSQEGFIQLAGMAPYAGNALTEPGHADGEGLAARFRAPFALAVVFLGGGQNRPECLVTDPENHVLRWLSEKGEVRTPWGQPGQPGYRDVSAQPYLRSPGGYPPWAPEDPGARALFNGPTFLQANPAGNGRWKAVISDSGNHVLRRLHWDGAVETLAGVPGQAGFRDADPAGQALFNNPQGLAEDVLGNLYVADQGNFVIRKRTREGWVGTLAGSPGEPGSADGRGASARFTRLRGMAIFGSHLYAVDSHAIRCISLPDGEVTTPVGVVATSGFQDVLAGAQDERRRALKEPCLNQPCGLSASTDVLAIADQGNNSVRLWKVREGTLETLVGEPGTRATRGGLLRGKGMQVPLDERFAALDQPRAVVASRKQAGAWLVSTGSCVAEILANLERRDLLGPITLTCPAVTTAEACVCRFSVPCTTPAGVPSQRPIHYTVDFLEPDGTVAERLQGTGTTATPVTAQGQFAQRGKGTVVVRRVTDQGVSAGVQGQVDLQ
jgi:hypothetical protein